MKTEQITIDVTADDIGRAFERVMSEDADNAMGRFCPISIAVGRHLSGEIIVTKPHSVYVMPGDDELRLVPHSEADLIKHQALLREFGDYVVDSQKEREPKGELPAPCTIEYDKMDWLRIGLTARAAIRKRLREWLGLHSPAHGFWIAD